MLSATDSLVQSLKSVTSMAPVVIGGISLVKATGEPWTLFQVSPRPSVIWTFVGGSEELEKARFWWVGGTRLHSVCFCHSHLLCLCLVLPYGAHVPACGVLEGRGHGFLAGTFWKLLLSTKPGQCPNTLSFTVLWQLREWPVLPLLGKSNYAGSLYLSPSAHHSSLVSYSSSLKVGTG